MASKQKRLTLESFFGPPIKRAKLDSTPNGTPASPILRQVDVPSTQNIQLSRRILDRVVIPKSTRTPAELSEFKELSDNENLSSSPDPLDTIAVSAPHLRRPVHASAASRNSNVARADPINRDTTQDDASSDASSERPSRRPRRAKRVSYLPTPVSDDHSLDEIEQHGDDAASVGSEFEEVEHSAAEDFSDAGSVAFSEHDTVESEDDLLSDTSEVVAPKKGKGRVSAAANTKLTATPVASSKVKVKSGKTRMVNLTKNQKKGIALNLPPRSDITAIFTDMTEKALSLGFRNVTKNLRSRPLRVATMCSGTESPLLALEMIRDVLVAQGEDKFNVVHLFSAEIEPFKQAYIERNFAVPIIFRDITELTKAKDTTFKATTAYGSKVDVPQNLDLIIAGTACVDFSGLNSRKKDLADNGESGDTFRAVLAFAKVWRPRILILENVFGAPWDSMFEMYEEAGYDVGGVTTDTKDFYLPQTRQRGYMVCFDRELYGSRAAKAAARKWEATMEQLKRPASSPVSAFLLPNDDPMVIRSRALRAKQASMASDNVREVDWSKCAIRHIQYRRDEKLGNARPYTSWQESGTLLVPDYADREWHSKQVERVWDMQECSILRKARVKDGNYDAMFKTRIWDVSQNIDRFTDQAPFGIATCLTPSGIFFITDRGGPLTHHESMILQGLPLHKISFTTETGKQIQDLAGNAMSSTVIGSAILSALVAGFQDATVDSEVMDTSEENVRPQRVPTAALTNSSQAPIVIAPSLSKLDVTAMVMEAEESSQKCSCEGPNDLTDKPIQTCQVCAHTTCLGCGGKPVHSYGADHLSKRNRTDPTLFVKKWGPLLPPQLVLNNVSAFIEQFRQHLGKSSMSKDLLDAILPALSHTFCFSKMHRGAHWTITYDAPSAILQLVLKPSEPRWKLYIKPSPLLPGESVLRTFLQRPIAQSEILSSDFLGTTWECRAVESEKLKVTMTGQGEHIASWMARLNLPGFEHQRVWQKLEIHVSSRPHLSGIYEHFPRCGTACESLYKKVSASDNAAIEEGPIFLMLDPDGIRDPSTDCFVFTTDTSRKKPDETRQAFAKLDPSWRPWLEDKQLQATTATTEESWRPAPVSGLTLELNDTPLKLQNTDYSVSFDHCAEANALFHVDFPVSDGLENRGIRLVDANDKDFFSSHAWVFEPLLPQIGTQGWRNLEVKNHDIFCQDCVPAKPEIRWKLGSDGSSLKPYEDPSTATRYEDALKRRPAMFEINVSTTNSVSRVTVGLNVLSLAHRALAKLQRMGAGGDHPSVTWILDPSFAQSSKLSFAPFTLKNNDLDASFSAKSDLIVELWPKQKQSLAWMLSQEQGDGQATLVEEAEEAMLPHLSWRAEARASKVDHVRGGIQASHPGFGKTICALALVQSDFQDGRDNSDVISSMKPRNDTTAGLERIAATLVIAPKHLTKQWMSEVTKVLGKQYATRTIAIHIAKDLLKYEMRSFRTARLIIVNQEVFTSEAYVERLAQFAGVPEPATTKRREFEAWLEFATKEIPEHLKMLQQGSQRALTELIQSKFTRHLEDEVFQAMVPSKRLKGKAYAEKEHASVKSSKQQRVQNSKLKVDNIDKCLFEWFEFNRIIVDEFTYLTPKDYASVLALKADKRWALSATAGLQDVCDIARMASLIGVKLRVGENAPGAISNRNLKAIRSEMTDFELFQTFRDASSNAMTERTNELAQQFLDDFVRQNILEFEDFPYSDHIVPITLDLNHRIVYTELSQHLNSQDMRIKTGNKRLVEDRDREHRLYENLKDVLSAEEALSRLAANFGATDQDALVNKRERECKTAERRLEEAIVVSQKLSAKLKGTELGFDVWKHSVIVDGVLGDEETTEVVARLVKEAEEQYPCSISGKAVRKAKSSGDDEDVDSTKKTSDNKSGLEIREATSKANALAKQLLATRRSIRFVKNAQLLSAKQCDASRIDQCDCEGCEGTTVAMATSSLCGHLICNQCLELVKTSSGLCRAGGCKAPVQDYHLLRSTKISEGSNTLNIDSHGTKIKAVMDRLEIIEGLGDQAILFVRYESQISVLEDACKERHIRCTPVRDDAQAARLVTKFQDDRDPNTRSTVIILNASNASAAGVNLTNANHVLFLSPLLTDTQYDYDANMAQAIGRSRRPGQEKDIHVYRFVSLDTIDVDILEHRERRNNALTEYGASAVALPAGQAKGKSRLPEGERTQLIKGNDGVFRLMPKSWLLSGDGGLGIGIEGRARVQGYEDFSSLVKFSKAYSEED